MGVNYVDRNLTLGIENEDINEKYEIYDGYVNAFKEGIANIIKEEYDSVTQEIIPQKYYAGGVAGHLIKNAFSQEGSTLDVDQSLKKINPKRVALSFTVPFDEGMLSDGKKRKETAPKKKKIEDEYRKHIITEDDFFSLDLANDAMRKLISNKGVNLVRMWKNSKLHDYMSPFIIISSELFKKYDADEINYDVLKKIID